MTKCMCLDPCCSAKSVSVFPDFGRGQATWDYIVVFHVFVIV